MQSSASVGLGFDSADVENARREMEEAFRAVQEGPLSALLENSDKWQQKHVYMKMCGYSADGNCGG